MRTGWPRKFLVVETNTIALSLFQNATLSCYEDTFSFSCMPGTSLSALLSSAFSAHASLFLALCLPWRPPVFCRSPEKQKGGEAGKNKGAYQRQGCAASRGQCTSMIRMSPDECTSFIGWQGVGTVGVESCLRQWRQWRGQGWRQSDSFRPLRFQPRGLRILVATQLSFSTKATFCEQHKLTWQANIRPLASADMVTTLSLPCLCRLPNFVHDNIICKGKSSTIDAFRRLSMSE